jgi:hypothetical protein
VRDEVLSTTQKDFAAFGDRLHALNKHAKAAVVGSKSAFETANLTFTGDDAIDVQEV